jgi:hypothetical protein
LCGFRCLRFRTLTPMSNMLRPSWIGEIRMKRREVSPDELSSKQISTWERRSILHRCSRLLEKGFVRSYRPWRSRE